MWSREKDELPFRVVGMTMNEFYDELYEDLPSDTNQETSESEEENQNISFEAQQPEEIEMDVEIDMDEIIVNASIDAIENDYKSESEIPLNVLRDQLMLYKARTNITWKKTHPMNPNLPFNEECGVANFVKQLDDYGPDKLFDLTGHKSPEFTLPERVKWFQTEGATTTPPQIE
ncbi:hypothetical protein JTB14_022391 [Gonioctena quinquepunctata]|nr:hypothetical protein JTB14_022391 [Gonioctena quinquepunctata]